MLVATLPLPGLLLVPVSIGRYPEANRMKNYCLAVSGQLLPHNVRRCIRDRLLQEVPAIHAKEPPVATGDGRLNSYRLTAKRYFGSNFRAAEFMQ